MKLKEAQMLGVLALIAVGIILLCMWGDEPTATGGDADVEQALSAGPVLEPDLAELYHEILGLPSAGSVPSQPADPTFNLAVGGRPPAWSLGASEDAVLRSIIEQVAPEQIPLTQPATEAPKPQATPAPEPPRSLTHVVRSGETLSAISKKYYGTTANWQAILEANANVVREPRDLRPDMKLVIPATSALMASVPSSLPEQRSVLSARAPEASSSARSHAVVKGDTLFRIALKYYGDGSRYRDVLAANRALVSKPQDLRPGMKLVIP